VVLGCIALLAAALHAPGIHRPFGVHENNAGNYFGVFARNWERHGFGRLRGAPVGPYVTDDLAHAQPYLNHPPGFAWLVASLGSDEGALRTVTAIGHAATAMLLFVLLRRRLSSGASAVGAAAALAMPGLAFYSQVSYEALVLPWGLSLFLACDPLLPPSRGRHAAASVVALTGVLLDWQFGLWVLALVVWVGTRPLVAATGGYGKRARLLSPWLAAAFGIGLMLVWRRWVRATPGLPPGAGLDLADLAVVVTLWPPFLEWASACAHLWLACFTGGVLAVAAAGAWILLRRMPGLMLALGMPGLLWVVALPAHASSHAMFHVGLTPVVAASLAAAACAHRGLALAAVAACAWAAWQSHAVAETARTPFFAILGDTLSREAEAAERGTVVGHNAPFAYAYYVASADVILPPICDASLLENARTALPKRRGLSYLYLEAHGAAVAALGSLRPSPQLSAYLAAFPRRRCPELEVTVRIPPSGEAVVIDRAWMVRLQ